MAPQGGVNSGLRSSVRHFWRVRTIPAGGLSNITSIASHTALHWHRKAEQDQVWNRAPSDQLLDANERRVHIAEPRGIMG